MLLLEAIIRPNAGHGIQPESCTVIKAITSGFIASPSWHQPAINIMDNSWVAAKDSHVILLHHGTPMSDGK